MGNPYAAERAELEVLEMPRWPWAEKCRVGTAHHIVK